MSELVFGVAACQAWSPTRQTWAEWCAWAGATPAAASADEAANPPVILRRRVSKIGQMALKSAWGLPQVRSARYVFASRHGELDRTVSLMRAAHAGEPLSPADFSLSVHNALAGLLSIAAGNRAGHTTVTAGPDSFVAGLLEAASAVVREPATPAMLVFHHDPPGPPYDELVTRQPSQYAEPLIVALALTGAGDAASRIGLSIATAGSGADADDAPALGFLRFLLAGHARAEIVGARQVWRFRHV